MKDKNNKPQNDHEFLRGIFEEMIVTKAEDKKIVKEGVSKPVVEPKVEISEEINEDSSHKSFNEITNDLLVQEGWFDRFVAKSKGRGAEIGTKASNLANKVKTGASNIKTGVSNIANVAKGNTANVKGMQQATTANAEHAKIQSTIQHIYSSGFMDSINDMIKLGLISGTNTSKIEAPLRKSLSEIITNVLQVEEKLQPDESLVIKNKSGETFIMKNTPVTNTPSQNPQKQNTPSAPNTPNLGGKPVKAKKSQIPVAP